MARKTSYTREVADRICERMAEGETLRQICRTPGYPKAPTVIKWADQDIDGFRERYARARAALVDHWAEEIIEIADDSSHDTVTTDGGERCDNEWVQRSRLRVDTRKWLLSKLRPEQYGDRQKLDLPAGFSIEIKS